MSFLPALSSDLAAHGFDPGGLDAIFVTGDAYVDHVSFGAALLGRLLEAEGYKVGIIARPDPDDVEAFRLLGRPRLAFLVSSGALDSMVSSYTANKKPRSEDEYAPGGRPELCLRGDGTIGPGVGGRRQARPDRAVIAYATKCREAYKGVPIVVGGVEASLRALAHYDYWSDKVRRSVLIDSKADILVHGMGELALVEILRRLRTAAESGPATSGRERGRVAERLRGIPGTAWAASSAPGSELGDFIELPAYEELSGSDTASKRAFLEATRLRYVNADHHYAKILVQRSETRWTILEPPARPLAREELDRVHGLPYERAWHPMYDALRGVPALDEVKFSLVSNRGCFGGCSFCSITLHQGRAIASRGRESLLREAAALTKLPGFKGYIHDLGGPTADFRASACAKTDDRGACPDRLCLTPEPCPALRVDHSEYLGILRALRALPGVKKVFVRSGIRFDYLMLDRDESFFRELVEHHVSGQLKVAPEHASDKVLALMGKPRRAVYESFARRYAELNREAGLKQYLVPYYISAHPGAGLAEAIELAEFLRDTGFVPDQVQDFYPTPGTLSTAMYWTDLDPASGEEVHVARGERERAMQRALLQYNKPANRELVRDALISADRRDLIGEGKRCLIR
jgi:uncharacterized radical SAM protein YgiQ